MELKQTGCEVSLVVFEIKVTRLLNCSISDDECGKFSNVVLKNDLHNP